MFRSRGSSQSRGPPGASHQFLCSKRCCGPTTFSICTHSAMSGTATSSARLEAMLSSLRSRFFAMDGRLPVPTCQCTPQFFVARHAQTRTNNSGARPSGSIASFLSTRHSVKFSSFETFWQWVNGAWRTQIHVPTGVWSSHDAGPPNTMMMFSALRSNVSCTLLISR